MKKHNKATRSSTQSSGNSTQKPPSKSPSKASKSAPSTPASAPIPQLPLPLQTSLLSIFKSFFHPILTSPNFTTTLQEVKGALFDRDFERAFGKQDYLEAYAARWSPSRALGYAALVADLRSAFRESRFPVLGDGPGVLDVVCLGGGAAETVAFGGVLRYLQDVKESTNSKKVLDSGPAAIGATEAITEPPSNKEDIKIKELTLDDAEDPSPSLKLTIHLIDTAPWGSIVDLLTTSLTTVTPPLSNFKTATTTPSKPPFLPSSAIETRFTQVDLLSSSSAQLSSLLATKATKENIEHDSKDPKLVTLLFTLNELYTTSVAKTTAFLLNLTALLPAGSFLLVVDSPGSYSEAGVGASPSSSSSSSSSSTSTSTSTTSTTSASQSPSQSLSQSRPQQPPSSQKRKYPMHWLLDHTLLGPATSQGEVSDKKGGKQKEVRTWEKVVSEESRWFRLSPELAARYPIGLENMRVQVHLFRRL